MRNLLLAGALLIGIASGSTSALAGDMADPLMGPTPMSGHLEFFGQKASQDFWGDPYNPWWGFGGAARVNWWMHQDMSMQFDIAGQRVSDADSNYYWTGSLYGAAHLSKRTDTYLIGVFGGIAATSDYEGEYGWDTSIFGGVEGQMYFGNFTLYGQAGFLKQFAGYYSGIYNMGLPFAQIEGRYFLTPNTKVAVNVGVVSGNVWGYYDPQTTLTYGGEIEHKFSTNPISVFGRIQGFHASGSNEYSGHRLMVGAKLNFGTDTLFAQDRSGATLKVYEDLSPIGDFRGWD
jgi:hypothetical protein